MVENFEMINKVNRIVNDLIKKQEKLNTYQYTMTNIGQENI